MKNKSGFTLIELMVIIAIIGILASVVIPVFQEKEPSVKESSLEDDKYSGKLRSINEN